MKWDEDIKWKMIPKQWENKGEYQCLNWLFFSIIKHKVSSTHNKEQEGEVTVIEKDYIGNTVVSKFPDDSSHCFNEMKSESHVNCHVSWVFWVTMAK